MSAAPRPHRSSSVRRILSLVIGFMALFGQSTPAGVHAAQTWAKNLYDARAFVYQDPYGTACTAASTMIMLNTIAYRKTGGATFRWTPYRVKDNTTNRADTRDMTSILWFSRAHDTLAVSGSGSDGHGWRNALNAYGWGNTTMTNRIYAVYEDLEYTSYDAAVHAAVRGIARYGMPVGILAWGGGHAVVMTGYVVDGEDPATSDAFAVQYVYLSDPLYADHMANTRVSNATFKGGTWRVRFQAYRATDSPYDDTYRAGFKRSSVSPTRGPSEWYRRWVIVTPIRLMAPSVDPTPTPSPSPSPGATPTAPPSDARPSDAPSTEPSPSTSPSIAP